MFFRGRKDDRRLRLPEGGQSLFRRDLDALRVPLNFHVRHVIGDIGNKVGGGDSRESANSARNEFEAMLPFLLQLLLILVQVEFQRFNHAYDFLFADFLTATDRVFVRTVVEKGIGNQVSSTQQEAGTLWPPDGFSSAEGDQVVAHVGVIPKM